MHSRRAHILVLDSGLGGLSVLAAIADTMPHAPLIYVADNAAFPYGNMRASALLSHVKQVIDLIMQRHNIALVVVACNTLSTLCLPALRAAYDCTFVGTVPAIKTAARDSRSRRFTVLATPNTARSETLAALISAHASDCRVDIIAATHLAGLAERLLLGEPIEASLVAQEIRVGFLDDAQGKTDTIVLGCTHYPFLLPLMHQVSPWPVLMIDPALAIAKQTARVWPETFLPLAEDERTSLAYVTRADTAMTYAPVFARFGFAHTEALFEAAMAETTVTTPS